MPRTCFVCSRADSVVTLHSFPKNIQTCLLWKEFCGLRNDDDVSKVYVCTLHFTIDDYQKSSERPKLKAESVPSIQVHRCSLKIKEQPKRGMCNIKVPKQYCMLKQSIVTEEMKENACDINITETKISRPYHRASNSTKQFVAIENNIDNIENITTNIDNIQDNISEIEAYSHPCSTPKRCKLSEPAISHTNQNCSVIDCGTATGSSANNVSETKKEITLKKRKFYQPRYINEVTPSDFGSPRRAKIALKLIQQDANRLRVKSKILQQRNRRLTNRIHSLKGLLLHLRQKCILSEDASDAIMDGLSPALQALISRNLKSKGKAQYTPELRTFALTLQFYSNKAYTYVRKMFRNLLPNPSTIRAWYSVIDGRPGFTKEAFIALTTVKGKDGTLAVNVVLDEMAIRQQLLYDNATFYGSVNLGVNADESCDNPPLAKNALVFMAVALTKGWKVPLGYFLIKSLNGSERANLLSKCFELLEEAGITVHSITFDGAPVNLNMCTSLGANLKYGKDFKPWFENPITKEKVLIFFDACHMVKLVRNTFGDKRILLDGDNNVISWELIINLVNLQSTEGLHAATKITKKHINFNDNRMNVKLAAQTLSESVSKALIFAKKLNLKEFSNCDPTAKFCQMFNDIFDMLNCRNKFAKYNKFNIALNESNYKYLLDNQKKFISYIEHLKDSSGSNILLTNRKTGFLGSIICLTNLFELFNILKQKGLNYLLSFKLSQDFIETFFSGIRSRGGFNNNPNAKQFEAAYKRLLIKQEVCSSAGSNCLNDDITILHISSSRRNFKNPLGDCDDILTVPSDHDYITTLWTLSPYVENVVAYIAGFIVNKIRKMNICTFCINQLVGDTDYLLTTLKNRGKYIFPSEDVVKICETTEKFLRQNISTLMANPKMIGVKLFSICGGANYFTWQEMIDHIMAQDILDNHRTQLIKLIINIFIKTRTHHETKTRNLQSIQTDFRHKYSRLILFKHQ